jgi:hypothetical protein
MQGFYLFLKEKNPFKNVQVMVTSCKTSVVTEHGLILRGLKRRLRPGNHGFARFIKLL